MYKYFSTVGFADIFHRHEASIARNYYELFFRFSDPYEPLCDGIDPVPGSWTDNRKDVVGSTVSI